MKLDGAIVDAVRELGAERGAPLAHGIKELALQIRKSARQLYVIHDRLFSSNRKPRSDRGKQLITLNPAVRDFMFALTKQTDLDARNVILATARHHGLDDNFMSVSTYNRLLRKESISRTDLKSDRNAYREHIWRARANELFQFDATVAKAFYANPDGSIGFEPAWANYKNKPGNRRPRLILWSGTDYFSRVIFARFCFRETTQTLMDFCFWAWSKKDDPRFPAYGIPDAVYPDEGSSAKAGIYVGGCEKLGTRIIRSEPSHWTEFGARVHGGVERTFGSGLLDEFMKWTKIVSFKSVDELNEALFGYLVRLNNRKQRGKDETRFAAWLRTVGTPRSMPSEEMRQLLRFDMTTRLVGLNMRIQLNGKVFELPNEAKYSEWVGKTVKCYWYRGAEDKATFVYDFSEIDRSAIKQDDEKFSHEYEQAAKSGREDFLKRLDEIDLSSINVKAVYAPDNQVPYVPRAGLPFNDGNISEKRVETTTGSRPSLAPEHWLTRKAAIRELQGRDFFRSPPSAGDWAWLDALWLNARLDEQKRIGETELLAAVRDAEDKMIAGAGGE